MNNEDVIIDISFIIIELIFGIITRLYLFKKVGIPRWKVFIPLYGDAVAYKVTDMSMLWIFSELPQILVSIPGLRVPVWLDGLAYAINYGVDLLFAFKLTKAFNKKNGLDVHKSVIRGYNKSIQAILTSAGVLTIVTAIVGNFASSTAAKICKAISDGTFFSTLLILLLLPALMAACDKFVVKNKK